MRTRFAGSPTVMGIALLMWAGLAYAAQPPETKCEAGKNQESGKYAYCLAKADAKLLKTKGLCSVAATACYRDEECPALETCDKDTTKYGLAVTKCEDKYAAKWISLEQKAIDKSGTCPDNLLVEDIKAVIDECVSNVAAGLAGEGLADCAGDLATCSDDLGACNGNLGTCNGNYATCFGDLGTCNTDLGTAQSNLTTCNGDLGTCLTDLGQSQSDLTTCTGDLSTCSGDLGTCTGDLATCNAALGTCPADLATCLVEPEGQRVRTGLTLCYDVAGTLIACAGTGQDGELLQGLMVSFTDNGDGTITDNRTGLMWEKISDDGSIHDKDTLYTWINSFTKIATLNGGGGFAGHTDWRLPNINELQSLANYGAVGPAPAVHAPFNTGCAVACTVLTCSCTQSSFYWSATTRQSAPTSAWFVFFNEGSVGTNSKSFNGFSVRGVRGGS